MLYLSPLLLLLTIPFYGSKMLWGAPLWAYISLFFTLLYAVVLVIIIEKKWKRLKDDNE